MTKIPGARRLVDGRWKLRVSMRDGHGKRHQREQTLPSSTSRTMVRTALKQMRVELEADLQRAESPVETVREYVMRWGRERGPDFAEKTRDTYAQALELMLQSLGDIECTSLRRSDVVAMVDSWGELRMANGREYSARTISSWWRPCRMVLADLCADHEIYDVTRRVTVRRLGDASPRRDTRTPTIAQVDAMLRWTYETHPGRYAEVAILAHSGMRIGEMRGLQWRDLDFDARTISINRAISRREVKAPKTEGSIRVLPMTGVIEAALLAHRVRLVERGLPVTGEAWVVASATGTPREYKPIANLVAKAAEAAGVPFRVTPHQLRRFVNSRLLEAGIDRAVVQSQLGHVTDAMTDHYADPHLSARRSALRAVLGAGAVFGAVDDVGHNTEGGGRDGN